ncbi:hypothetical protein GCM10009830_47050 [Glycomyces endophyticus]|uniref:SUKH-4 immunity protein of toxin-antitoxin system n=1 Tax=Glycomyces endophyticus TaxID=480996 RepID=A0ABP4TU36_9ACTN
MTDQQIARDLADRADTPYPGEWQEPPFREHRAGDRVYALVASDPGLSDIGVDRAGGGVWLLPEGDAPALVNTSAAAFTACSKVYAESAAEVERVEAEDPDEDEDRGDAFTEMVLERLAAIDPAAVEDENGFWPVAAEELGYAMP